MNITSLRISVKSDGIDDATASLNSLAQAAGRAERAIGTLSSSSRTLSDSQKNSADAIEKLIAKFQKQVDLLGANTSQTNAYNAAMKGANDLGQQMAAMLGAEVDAYRALGDAQKAAISDNKSLDASYKKLQDSADAYYAAQARAQSNGNALNALGERQMAYKKLSDAQGEAMRMNAALDASNARLERDHGAAIQIEKERAYRALSKAQSEAISQNNEMDAATKRAKASGDAFIQNLTEQTGRLGLTGRALHEYNVSLIENQARTLGVSSQAAPMIAALKATDGAAHGAHSGIAGITREMIVMAHELSQGSFSRLGGSAMVMAEKFNVAAIAMRGFAAAAEVTGLGVTALLSVISLIVIAIGTAIAALVAMHRSVVQFKEMTEVIAETGHASGLTADSMLALAHAATATRGSLSDAKDVVMDLAKTGRYSAEQMGAITESITSLASVSHTPIKDLEERFAGLASGIEAGTIKSTNAISRNAERMNAQYHFMDEATMDRIISMENEGNAQGALSAATDAMVAANKKSTEEIEANLSTSMKTLHEWGREVASVWDKIAHVQTRDSQIADLEEKKVRNNNMTLLNFIAPQSGINANKRIDDDIANLREQWLRADTHAQQLKDEQDLNDRRVHDLKMMDLVDKHLRSKSAAQEAYDTFRQQRSSMSAEEQLKNKAKWDEDELLLLKKTQEKVVKVKSEGLSGVNAQQKQYEVEYKAAESAYGNQLKVIEMFHKSGEMSDQAYLTAKATTLQTEIDNTKTYYGKAVADLENFHGKTLKERNLAASKVAELRLKESKALSDLGFQKLALSQTEEELASRGEKAAEEKSNKEIEAINKNIVAIQAQIDAYNSLPDAMKAVGVSAKQMQDHITEANINALKEQLTVMQEFADGEKAAGNASADSAQKVADAVQAKIVALTNLGKVQTELEVQQKANVLNTVTTKAAEKLWQETDKKISDDLANAIIDGGGSGFKKLIRDMEIAFAKVILRPLLAPISGGIASYMSPTAVSAAPIQGIGSQIGMGQGIGLLQSAKSAYSAVSDGFQSVGATVGNGVQSAIDYVGGTSGVMGPTATGGNIAAGGSASSMAGTAATYVAGMAAGKLAGSAISGQYGIGNHGSAVVNIGTAIGALWGPVFAMIGGAIGGLVNRAFGMGKVKVTGQGVEGSFGAGGFSGNDYANTHQDGGWFRSDKNSHKQIAMDVATQNQFTDGFNSVKSVSSGFAKALGLDATSIANYSQKINIALTGDATKDAAIIAKLFTDMADAMATNVAPHIADYAKSGETSSATLQRLSVSLSAVNGMFDTLNLKLYATSIAGADTASKLIDLFGGLSNMQTITSSYFQSYYSDQERVDITTRQLTKSFSDLGYAMPASNAALRSYIEAQDLTTTAGQKAYVDLMNLSGSFANLTSETAKLSVATSNAADLAKQRLDLEIQIMELQGNASGALAAKRKIEIGALDATLQPLQEVIYGLQDAATSASDAKAAGADAFAVLQKSITDAKAAATVTFNDAKTAITATLDTAKTANTAIAALATSLQGWLDSNSLATEQVANRQAAQAQIAHALAIANSTGVLPTSADLANSLKVVAQPSENLFATFEDYSRDFAVTSGKIAALNVVAGKQKSVSDQQLDALQNSLDVLQKNYDATIKGFDDTLTAAQAQLDAVNGTTVAVTSVSEAISALTKAILAMNDAKAASTTSGAITGLYKNVLGRAPDAAGMAYWTAQANSGASIAQISAGFTNSVEAKLDGLYSSVLGRAPDAAGMAFWTDRLNSGESMADVTSGFYNSDEYKKINGSHANGLHTVPFDNYVANLHAGERVLTAKQSVDADTTAEEIRQMRADMNAALLSIAQNTGKTSKTLLKFDGDGMPQARDYTTA